MNEEKRGRGRPLKFQSVQELEDKINQYFSDTPEDEWTWTGLALHLDTDKETLSSYKGREDFSVPIKKAFLKVENGYEKDLKKYGRSGTIFALKNFKWTDRTETDITTGGEQINFVIPKEIAQKNDFAQNTSDSSD